MKYFFTLIIALLFGCSEKKACEIRFKVRGNCSMCQDRIEEASLSVKGVKSAAWDSNTSMISICYDSTRTSETRIHEAIASAGHSTDQVKMDPKAHDNLPECCQEGARHMR